MAGALGGESQRIEVLPYEALARIYDDVMDHIDYSEWARHVHRIARRMNRKPPGHAVDLACGTGALAEALTGRGWHVTGVDGAARMVDVARQLRSPARGTRLGFAVADLREVPDIAPADLLLCLYDSLNYLMQPEALSDFFRAAHATLAPRGLLIFDLSTVRNSVSHFDGYVYEERVRGGSYRRQTRYDAEESIQHNLFEINFDGDPATYLEHHEQRIWGIEEVISVARAEGLRHLATYHEMTLKPGGEGSDRVHIAVEPA